MSAPDETKAPRPSVIEVVEAGPGMRGTPHPSHSRPCTPEEIEAMRLERLRWNQEKN